MPFHDPIKYSTLPLVVINAQYCLIRNEEQLLAPACACKETISRSNAIAVIGCIQVSSSLLS